MNASRSVLAGALLLGAALVVLWVVAPSGDGRPQEDSDEEPVLADGDEVEPEVPGRAEGQGSLPEPLIARKVQAEAKRRQAPRLPRARPSTAREPAPLPRKRARPEPSTGGAAYHDRAEVREDTTVMTEDEEPVEPMIYELSREGVNAAFEEQRPKFRECYGAWQRAHPDLGGVLEVMFVISEDPDDPENGKVTDVGINESELDHELLEGCVLNTLGEMRFEVPEGGSATFRRKMIFSNEASEEEGE